MPKPAARLGCVQPVCSASPALHAVLMLFQGRFSGSTEHYQVLLTLHSTAPFQKELTPMVPMCWAFLPHVLITDSEGAKGTC